MNSMELLRIPSEVSLSRISNMAAVIPEVNISRLEKIVTPTHLHRAVFGIVPLNSWTPIMGVNRWNGVAI